MRKRVVARERVYLEGSDRVCVVTNVILEECYWEGCSGVGCKRGRV